MSNLSSADPARAGLDLRAELVRIDRCLAETHRLLAEGRKFNCDPWFLVVGAVLAATVSRLPEILKAFGALP